MKILIYIAIALAAAAGATWILSDGPGYVRIDIHSWVIETSFAVFSVLAVVLFITCYFLLRLISGTLRAPKKIGQWNKTRKTKKSQKKTTEGLIALTEGQWSKAEKLLTTGARNSETPQLNYLGAAQAAEAKGLPSRRESYLGKAQSCDANRGTAAGIAQAEQQLKQKEYEPALTTLLELQKSSPKHPQILKLLAMLYVETGQWGNALALVPQLRKRESLAPNELVALEIDIWRHLLENAAHQDLRKLHEIWNQMPSRLHQQEDLVFAYTHRLNALDSGHEAETLLRKSLRKHWSESLIYAYGFVEGANPEKQLKYAESWLSKHPDDATLFLTLGRLCLKTKSPEQALKYFHSSLKVDERPETYQEAGNLLLQQMGKNSEALECFRKGLALTIRTIAQPGVFTKAEPVLQKPSQVLLPQA
ncbi:MAG TPA: tetratricopeptide repeat protein [Gammaproteobacteria bacterium]|nr:tetratricopeptide repeat protein [Gammaproteobacteria bacterium]